MLQKINNQLIGRITLQLILCCLFVSSTLLSSTSLIAQCGSNVPLFVVDLSGKSDSLWVSSDTLRSDTCCGAVAPDKCVAFSLTLDSSAAGIIFDICDGAIPPGALFYQVACGPISQVGEPLCLSGPGPHLITFCKPGNNNNKYCITSIPKPSAGPDLAVNDGCIDTLKALGYDDTTIVWTSVFPGPRGNYDTSLSCTQDCPITVVNGGPNYPPFIDFEVCGRPIGECLPTPTCDTVRVFFYSTLNVVISPENPTVCFGSPGTWIKANPSGGNPPYQFLWSTNETIDSIFVGIGTYIVELSDGSGCPPTFDTVTVTAFANTILANAGNSDTICAQNPTIQLNGSVVAASGGRWFGAQGSFNPSDSTLNALYTPSAAEISAGFVDIFLVTTGNGSCPADLDTVRFIIENFDGIASFNNTNVSCNGLSDGTSTISVTGSNPPYSFLWDAQTGNQTTSTVTGLAVGVYSVTITDANGCTDTATAIINEPPPLLSNISSVIQTSCFGGSDGSATVTISGGTQPYQYSWPNNDTTATSSSLSAGTYIVTISDSNGCTITDTTTINEPSQLTVAISNAQNVSCNGGSNGQASAIPAGGTAPYTYLWSNSSISAINSGLIAGNYTVTITDNNGCTVIANASINQPPPIQITFTIHQNVSCKNGNDGSATINASGGTPPFNYQWPNNVNDSVNNGLSAGNFTVTVTDANGCTSTSAIQITEPTLLVATITGQTNVSCYGGNDGTATASANGGTLPYNYLWPSNNTGIVENSLAVGTYTVTVTDLNGCTAIASTNITQPDSINVIATLFNPSCFGDNDGRIISNTSGGTAPFTYNWSNGATTANPLNLRAGTYTLSITDSKGCITQRTYVLNEPNPIVSTITPDDTICLGDTVRLQISSSGGNGGYSYVWDNNLGNGNTKIVSPNRTTSYKVNTVDSKGCIAPLAVTTVFVRDLGSDNLSVSSSGNICVGENATITATHNGTLPPYNYSWNFAAQGLGTFTVSPTTDTWYILTVSDGCGNPVKDSVQVKVQNYPTVLLPETLGVGCSPYRLRYIDSLNKPASAYTYQWNFGNGDTAVGPSISYLYRNPGVFDVQLRVSTTNGCARTNQTPSKVIVKPSPVADFYATPEQTDIRNPYGQFINTTAGSNVSYEWTIDRFATARSRDTAYTFPDTGSYNISLLAVNFNGCRDSISKVFRVRPYFNAKIPNAFTPNQSNGNNGYYNSNSLNNDVFFIFADYAKSVHMMIFNRWGELIFESVDKNRGWDGFYRGEMSQSDVYVYKVEIEWVDGSKELKVGDVTLLR